MKRFLSIILILALCLGLSVCAFAAEADEQTSTIKVSITKTDIKADSVFNTDGYGSIKINEVTKTDPWGFVSYPQSALIDREGSFLFTYKDTWNRYYVSDGIVSFVCGAYQDHYFMVQDENDKWTQIPDSIGYYTLDGEAIYTGDYNGATPFKDGYAFVNDFSRFSYEEIKSFLIDKNGDVALELSDKFTERAAWGGGSYIDMYSTFGQGGWFSEGLLLCWTYADRMDTQTHKNESIYYIDATGEKVLELDVSEYAQASSFYEGLAMVESATTGKKGYIDKTGNLVIPCEYDKYSDFKDGLAYVVKDGKYGYINAQNEVVIPFEYDSAYGAGGGLASVGKDGKYGLVDYDNNVVVPLEYDDISSFEGGVAYAVKDGCVYIITEDKSEFILGDADNDSELTILDATCIQRKLVGLSVESYNEQAADADEDSEVTILDATAIQRHLASLPTNEAIGTRK